MRLSVRRGKRDAAGPGLQGSLSRCQSNDGYASRMSAAAGEISTALRHCLPAELIVVDDDVVRAMSTDRAMHCPAGHAAALVRPRTTLQVQQVMRVASALGVPVVPQGARSGLSGAANAVDGAILLGLDKMTDIVEVDVANRLVVAQAGVFNADLSRAVAAEGLFYPPDPSSWEFSTIGGNVATNAGGLCCVKYGVTADYVLALEVVLADGEVLHTGRRTAKGVAGYDLTRLFVGSEGTLGVITQVTLSLRPLADRPLTVAAVFTSARAAAAAVTTVMTREIVPPSLLEFMDRVTVRALDDLGFDFSAAAGAVVLAQSDATALEAADQTQRLERYFADAGAIEVAVADDPAEGELLLAARRQALVAMERLGSVMVDDVCVPRTRLADLIEQVEVVAAAHDLVIGVVGHAGDGNFHPTIVFDAHDLDQVKRSQLASDDIMAASLDLGGTITGEHGVGLLKREYLELELGPVSLRVHRDLKQALDPGGILNPGKVFRLSC